MFKICVYVDDKNLSKLLHLLDGQIAGEPTIRPVKGAAVAKDGSIKSTQLVPGGSMPANLAAAVLGTRKQRVSTQEIRTLISSIGGAPNAMSYYATALRKAGVIGKIKWNGKNRKLGGTYPVLKPKK